jgi:hypothetical protein
MEINTVIALFSALGTWGAIVGAAFVLWRQNKKQKELTCLQLYLKLSSQYESPEMNIRRARLATKLLKDPETLDIDDTLLVFYENIGLMLERDLLDIDLVDNVFGYDVRHYWDLLKHYIEYARKFDDTLYIYFEYLKNETTKHAIKKYKKSLKYKNILSISKTDFLQFEIRRELEAKPALSKSSKVPKPASPMKIK